MLALLLALLAPAAPPIDLPTVAERSGFTETARHAEVLAFADALAGASPLVTRARLGTSHEGRELPLLYLSDPPVADAAAARASGRPRVLLFGNIHAGEVCGKEALLMLARDLASPGHALRPLLDDLVVAVVPIYNADGNERVAPDHRPGQVGPAGGTGVRRNAQGLDLNRDWMKLEAPESRAMVALHTALAPHLVIDTHTTNGSHHRYALTYAAPQNPEADAILVRTVRDVLLPEIGRRVRARDGYETFFYGNLDEQRERWSTYSSQPRFGCPYRGLRGHLSILTEAYAYAPYETRVRVTYAFVRACLEYTAEHGEALIGVVERARARTVAAGARGAPLGLRHRIAPFPEPVTILGWDEVVDETGRRRPDTTAPRELEVEHWGRFEPTVTVARPRGYLILADEEAVLDVLAAHGIRTEPWPGGRGAVAVEIDRVLAVERDEQPFEGHRQTRLLTERRREARRLDGAWILAPTSQPLGTLLAYLLEPLSDDGLVTWNVIGPLAPGEDVPILRLAP